MALRKAQLRLSYAEPHGVAQHLLDCALEAVRNDGVNGGLSELGERFVRKLEVTIEVHRLIPVASHAIEDSHADATVTFGVEHHVGVQPNRVAHPRPLEGIEHLAETVFLRVFGSRRR